MSSCIRDTDIDDVLARSENTYKSNMLTYSGDYVEYSDNSSDYVPPPTPEQRRFSRHMTNSNKSGIGKQNQSDDGTESGLDIKWVDVTGTSDNTTAHL
jgi:hypothetical protein